MPVFAYASQSKGFFSQAIANGLQGLSLKARRRFLTEENEQKIGRVENLSKELGHSPSQIALGYVNSSSMPTCAIIGCSSLKQLHDSLGAKDLLLSKEHIAYLETGLRDGV
jgi:aryl-alcohol dehydrogenase-like predicted oxidoreductase